jgi:RNA polymerase sigma-70 factor (ECF subfamily)
LTVTATAVSVADVRDPDTITTGDITDAALARAIADADDARPVAEAELYRRFAPRVRLYGLRHLRDEDAAQDLAQQVMLLTIERLRAGEVRDPDQIGSFILGTSRMMAGAAQRRQRRRQALHERFIAPEAAADPQEPLDLDRLAHCLGQLAQRERLVLILTFYEERESTDVAAALAMSGGAVRVLRHRALARMRTCITDGGRDE